MAGKVKRFGGDAGNSAFKLRVEGLDESIYIPSVYSEAIVGESDDRAEEEVGDILDHLDCTITSPYLKEQKRYIVGNKVVNDNLLASYMPVGVKKSREEFPFILTLVALASAAIKMNPGKKSISAEFEGGISLPVKQINVEEAQIAESRLIGTHTVVLHLPGQDIKVTLHIPFVKCGTEAAIAAYSICYDYQGAVKNEEYLNAMHMFFDPGDGTTEFAVTVGTTYKKDLSNGVPIGVATSLDQIINTYNVNHDDYQLKSRAHAVKILLDVNHPRHIGVKEVSVKPLKVLSANLGTQFTNQLKIAQDTQYIHGLGGGSLILREHIHPIMEGRGYKISFLPDPVFTNANSLLIYALSPRFQAFKEKYLAHAETAAGE